MGSLLDSGKEAAAKAAAKAVSNKVPAALQNVVKQAAPQAQSFIQDLMPGSSGRIDPAAEAASMGMSLDQYNNLSMEELNRLKGSSEPGFFSKAGSAIGDFFTDDPNSGWFDTMKKDNADDDLVKQAMSGLGDQVKAQSIKGTPVAQSSGGIMDAFTSGLKKVATPANLETAAGIAGGLGSMYLNNQGTKAATAGQDAAQNLVRQAAAADLENFGKVGDSQEQLAYRQQAMRGLSDRASMGLTPEELADLQKINRQSAQQFKANNAAIGQDMQRRGMANSGLGLAQSMGAADQALQNQALAGQTKAAQSFAAKQGALTNLAGQSNTALQNDYSRQIGKAQNLSNVNQFNAQQQAINEQNKGKITQGAKTAQGQGVQDIIKGAIGTLGK